MSKETQQMFYPPISPLFIDDEDRWKAVQNRDANADGLFVYAVKTTKVYCRPICKARLARRANVSFYFTGDEAQKAGFRACKRCKPELQGAMPEEQAVRKIRAFIASQSMSCDDSRLSLSQMAKQTGLSKWHFHRVFKKCAGMTPSEFLRVQRDTLGSNGQLCTPPLTDDGFGWLSPEGDFDLGDFDFGLEAVRDATLFGDVQEPIVYDDFLVWPEIQLPEETKQEG